MNIFDTIAAVSTPYGKGGVALIRISGDGALSVADKVFTLRSGKKLSEISERKMVYGDIRSSLNGELVDDVMAVYMKAPNTYTGEDTVEITCHGGVLITQAVLSTVLFAGARAAEAGEYTRRAFINGRITLTEAESLGLMLEAKSATQLKLYRSGMCGKLSQSLCGLYDELCRVESSIFARIDYPDEDLADMSREQMTDSIKRVRDKLSALLATSLTGNAISRGIPAVICGRTNAGKSSLYNLIVGYDAAIVTDIEGTTRDVLREEVSLGKVLLRISDTAGLRRSDDVVESIGIERAKSEIRGAGIIFAVFDGSRPLGDDDRLLIEEIGSLNSEAFTVAIINKTDLGRVITDESEDMKTIGNAFSCVVPLCAATGDGFSLLVDAVEKAFIDSEIDLENDAVLINSRQTLAIGISVEALDRALEGISSGLEIDMCCSDVEEAMSRLGELDGRDVSEDIVSEIFTKFCVGK